MGKTLSRLVIEISIITGFISVFSGIALKLVHATSSYTPRFPGLTPMDFLSFGTVCFLFAIALTGRRTLKHIEHNNRNRPYD